MDLAPDRILSDSQADQLVSRLRDRSRRASASDRNAAELDELIVTSLLLSGLRTSEFCGLAVGDTVIGSGESTLVVRGSGSNERTVYVPRQVSDLIVRYVDQFRPRFVPSNVDPADQSQPLVLNEHRRRYERTGLYRRVARILTEAGYGDRASVQVLRHTYGYLAYLRTGGNLLFVQRQLGHSHPRITSVYAKFVDESYAELAERIAPQEREAWPRAAPASRGSDFDCEID